MRTHHKIATAAAALAVLAPSLAGCGSGDAGHHRATASPSAAYAEPSARFCDDVTRALGDPPVPGTYWYSVPLDGPVGGKVACQSGLRKRGAEVDPLTVIVVANVHPPGKTHDWYDSGVDRLRRTAKLRAKDGSQESERALTGWWDGGIQSTSRMPPPPDTNYAEMDSLISGGGALIDMTVKAIGVKPSRAAAMIRKMRSLTDRVLNAVPDLLGPA